MQNNQILAKRLLNKELDPQIILTMTPNELKVQTLSKFLLLPLVMEVCSNICTF
jgi:hypothetical protein